MVDHTIRTSAWAHNCGMHVIADYLVEKINNRNFQAVFTGAPYDALLTQFRTIYQQDNLSWHTLQRLTTKVTKIDSQIIWGYALRAMMTSVFQKNSEYKQALSEQFLEALNAFNNGQLDILSSTYANIFEANSDYFQSLAFLNNHQQANLDYWNRTGFNNYCATLSAFNESSQTFAWLSFDELTLFCRYLKIGSVFDEHKTKASAKNTIIFSNPTKIHWERKVKATQKNKAPEATEKSFFENLDTKRFTVGTKEIGELLFSDLKIEKTLWLDYLNLHTNDILKKCILNKNKKGFIDFIKNNPVINNEYDDLMAFIGAYFSSNELSDWLKTPGMDAKFSIPYNRILLSTVTHQKPFEFNYILSGLFDKLKPNDYMPALLFAIKYNYSDMAVKILDLPYFNQDSDTHKNLAKILNQLDKNKIPALYYGIKNKNLELVKKLLQKGASETTLKKFGKNILHLFSEAGSIEGVEFCLENKVSLFSKDNDGNTALHLAVENNHLAVVRRLVMNIIKYNESVYFPYAKYEWAQKNKQNQSALDIAYDNNFFPIIKHFRKIGYEDLIRKLYTELNNAIQESSNNFDEIISRNNKAIGLTDSNGNTILHYACCLMNNQHAATIIWLLIKHGQNVNALNNAGQSSLHLAANKNNTFAIRILLDKKAFIDVIDHHGLTPVHLAVISNSTEALEILKSASASLDIKAFPSAILRLPFSWDSNNPLTARNIIEVISNQSIKYDLRLMSDLPNNEPNNAAHNIIYLSQEGKYVTRDPQGMVHQDALPMDSGLLINQLEQALNNPVFKNTVLSITNKRSHTTALSKKTFNSRKLQAIHYIEDKLNFNNRYHLRLMSDFPNNEPEKAAPNTLYLSVEGKYAIRNTEGLLIQDSLPSGSGIDTNNLKDKLNDSAFKKSVLSITSKRGHTNLTNHYASNLYTELNNLEQTRTYQGLGMLKIGISVAGAAFLGPYFIPIELAKQGCLYAVPTIKKQAGQLYYTIKPGIHNYTWPCISNGFDYGATGISYASDGVFGLMSLNDWYNNFAPRAIGVGCGIGLLKLAQKLGVKNKECQAAVLFLAKEASYALVDAYNKTSPENKAHNAQAYLNIDKNLDHAYEVWTSILGKENGEKFVNAFHFIHQYQEKTYSYLGEMERAFLDPLAKNGKDLLEPFATGGRDALKPYARMGTDFFEQLGTMGKEYSKDFVDLLYLRGKDSLEPLYVRGKDSLESLGKIGADFFEPLYARGKDSLKPLGKVGADFLEQLSTMEENYLKQIKGYTEFQKIAGDVTKVITGVINFTFTPLAMTRLELNNLAETVAECRDRFLIGLNEAIHQNLIPESDYKRVVLNYITDQKIMLYAYKKQDLETQLKQAIIDENEIKIKSVKSIINSLETEITASEKFIKENSEYLSNSKVTNQYHTAQQNKIKAWNNLEDLNTLKTLNPESFIDMAYKDLGTDFSSLELTEYIRTMIHSQGIIINHDSYEAFQSKFDSAQLHNPEFIQNIKSELTTLWKTQVEGHIASSNDNFSAVYEKSQIEFDESLKSFVGSANPEELRVCDLNQNLEILKKKYDINLKYKNDYNQKNAFVQARFSPFIRDSLAYDEARDNLLIEEFLFEQTEHESNKIINESKAIYEQIEKELNLNFINLDKTQLMKEIANHVVSGKEGKEDRDKATKLMLDWAVCTGLLRSDEALTHKGDFYDALKKTEGKSVENEIKEALNKALFKAASVLLTNANAKIAAQNQLIESARKKLHAQKETFNKHQAILDNTKEITLKKLTSEDQHNFESFSKNLLKDISSSSEYYRELSEQNYLKKNYQELQALQTWASKLLEVQSRRLESLMKDLSEREPGYSNSTCTIIEKISTLIDSELSPIGSAKTNQLGDDAFFKKHFDNLLPDVAHEPRVVINVSDIKIKSESRKRHFLNQIDIVQNEMDILRKIMAIQNRDLEIIERKLEATNAKTNLAKEKYLEKLAPQQKESFYKLEAEYTEAEKKLTTFLSDVSKLPMPAVGNPAEYIGSVVNEGFKKYSDKQQMAEFYADQLIILQLQFNSGDLADPRKNKIILEQRQSYIDDLVNHELNRFEKNEHEVKRRLYDYMYAKIKDIPKKRHQHRLGKFFCPLINEIVSKLTGGYKPFKSYKGGDDLVEPVSLQANYQTNGSFTANIHFNDSADLPIYQRDPTPKVVEPTQPAIFQRNWDTTAKNVSTTQNQAAAAPLPPIMMNPSAHATPPLSIPGVFSLEQPLAMPSPNQSGTLPSSYYGYNNQSSSKQPPVNPVAKDAETAKNKSKAPAPQPSKPKAPATNNPKSQTSTAPKASTTPSKAVNEQSASSALPSDASITNPLPLPLPKENWLSLAYQSYKGLDTAAVRTWKRKNTEATPQWIVKVVKDMEYSTIPVPKLPGLVGRAAIELFSETVEFAGNVVIFNVLEIASFAKGEQTQTEKALKLMGKFVGEEVARIAAKEDTQSLKIAQEMVSNFNNLSQEDKVVSGTKLMFSLLPCIALNAEKVRGEGAENLLRIAKEAEKSLAVPKSVLLSERVAYRPQDSKNLGDLASKLQEKPKVTMPDGVGKTFTQAYDLKAGSVTIKRGNFSVNAFYLGEYKPHASINLPIPIHKAETFIGTTFKSYRLEQNILLYRVGNSQYTQIGDFFTFSKPSGEVAARIDSAIPFKWPGAKNKNIIDAGYSVSIPKGTIIHIGDAAPQGGIFLGGTEQVYIQNAKHISGIKIVEKYSIKEAYLWKQKVKK